MARSFCVSVSRCPLRRRLFSLVLLLLVAPFFLPLAPVWAARGKAEVRALWVTRWDIRSPEDVRAVVRNAAAVGFNTLYVQVRGEGTCFFPSRYEPWAWELTGGINKIGTNPGWDPLAYIIQEGHRLGLKVHAYVNVLPIWQQKTPAPSNSGHVTIMHPDWIMVDSHGRRMDPRDLDFYSFLNPAKPEVRQYLTNLFTDLVKRYRNLDGIHYDYVRYPGEVGEYSYDPLTLAEFKKHSKGASPAQAPELWMRFRCYLIDYLLAEMGISIRKANPKLEISSAVIADYETAVKQKGQHWLLWPDRNYVDTLVLMAYHYDMNRYARFLETSLGAGTRPKRGQIVIGIWPAPKWRDRGFTPEFMVQQINMARAKGADGIAIFSYAELFPDNQANIWAQTVQRCFLASR
ncbi:MAG TPA: family 10 glycosylhydrolase [Candidatus Sumerlaeota bacterium]|nr:family 10 glycosylhydrolase [Candidatus Sumerlaeota bacterium]